MPQKLDSIAEHIKKARLENKLSQRQLGEKLGVKKGAIGRWEKGFTSNIQALNYYRLIQFLNYCPLEQVPQTTGEQIFFYRKHRSVTKKQLADAIDTEEVEITLWEKNNFLVNCCGFGFTQEKKQKLKNFLQIKKLSEPKNTFTTGNLPVTIQTMGQHLQYRRETLKLSKRETEIILKLRRTNYTRWEKDRVQQIVPRLFVRLIDFLGYCPLVFHKSTCSHKEKGL